jgi:hypothetical protein
MRTSGYRCRPQLGDTRTQIVQLRLPWAGGLYVVEGLLHRIDVRMHIGDEFVAARSKRLCAHRLPRGVSDTRCLRAWQRAPAGEALDVRLDIVKSHADRGHVSIPPILRSRP